MRDRNRRKKRSSQLNRAQSEREKEEKKVGVAILLRAHKVFVCSRFQFEKRKTKKKKKTRNMLDNSNRRICRGPLPPIQPHTEKSVMRYDKSCHFIISANGTRRHSLFHMCAANSCGTRYARLCDAPLSLCTYENWFCPRRRRLSLSCRAMCSAERAPLQRRGVVAFPLPRRVSRPICATRRVTRVATLARHTQPPGPTARAAWWCAR